MNREMSRSQAFGKAAEARTEEVKGRSRTGRILVVFGIIAVIMLVAGAYIMTGDTIGSPSTTFAPLKDLPKIGQVTQAEGAKQGLSQGPKVGDTPPDFSFVDPSGQTKKLSDLKGQAVLINFWATWCPYCVQEMPDIESVYRANQDKGFVVLGISLDDDSATASKFLQLRGITFPSIMDTNSIATELYRIQPIPASFFIDRNGILQDIQIGAMSRSTVARKVDKIVTSN